MSDSNDEDISQQDAQTRKRSSRGQSPQRTSLTTYIPAHFGQVRLPFPNPFPHLIRLRSLRSVQEMQIKV